MEQGLTSVCEELKTMKSDIITEIKTSVSTDLNIDMVKNDILKEIQSKTVSVEPSASDLGHGELGDRQSTGPGRVQNASAQILESIQDRMDRKNNVLFFNVKEGEGNIKEAKRKHDTNQVNDITAEIGIPLEEDDILSVRRLGRRDVVRRVHGEEVTVPRLLLVSFTETVKSVVMKNAYKLQFSEWDYLKKIGIKHDMTNEERARDAELKKEAKAKTAADSSGNFLFLVKGPIWDRKIIKIRTARKQQVVEERQEGVATLAAAQLKMVTRTEM